MFRDSYQAICAYGFALYGLSQDSVKANINFKNKNNLPYTLICDQSGKLVNALGFRKPPKGIRRGVIVIKKSGEILVSMTGGPNATIEAVYPLIEASESKDAGTVPGVAVLNQVATSAAGMSGEVGR